MLGTTAHYMRVGERRAVPRHTSLEGGRGSKAKGKGSILEKGSTTQIGSSDAGQEAKRLRTKSIAAAMEARATPSSATEEKAAADVFSQWKHHVKANTTLYKQLGKSFEVNMDVEATCTLANNSSGLLGAAYRRHLKSLGVRVASKAAVRAHHEKYYHPSVSGKVTRPSEKRAGKTEVAAWLRITSLIGVCQSTINNKARSGDLLWRANIPPDEIWWQLVVDKGGSATKLVLKCCCDSMPDSVWHVVLLGIFDRTQTSTIWWTPHSAPSTSR